MSVYDREQISEALNRATDEICEAADLPDEGTRDALILLVNATLYYLEHKDADLATVAAQCYTSEPDEDMLDTVVRWIQS